MLRPAPQGLGTHSLLGTPLLPGAPWGGAGQAACRATPWPAAQRTDSNRHNPSGLHRSHRAVGVLGCPCPTLSLPHGMAALPSQGHAVRSGRAPPSALVPKVSPHRPPGGEQAAAVPPGGTGGAWVGAGAGTGEAGGFFSRVLMMDPARPLGPRGIPEGQAAGDGRTGPRLGAGRTVRGARAWPAPSKHGVWVGTAWAGSGGGRGVRAATLRPCNGSGARGRLRPTRALLTPRRPASPLLGSRGQRRGLGVTLTPPPDRTSAMGSSCFSDSGQVPRVLSVPRRCPGDTGCQAPCEPNSLACPALPTRPPKVAVAGGRGRRHTHKHTRACAQTDRARGSHCLTVLKQI